MRIMPLGEQPCVMKNYTSKKAWSNQTPWLICLGENDVPVPALVPVNIRDHWWDFVILMEEKFHVLEIMMLPWWCFELYTVLKLSDEEEFPPSVTDQATHNHASQLLSDSSQAETVSIMIL